MKYIPLLLVTILATTAFASGFEKTLKLAEKGDVVAQYNLGQMYRRGEGVPENDALAVVWYRKAANQGYAYAQYNLGYMYANGEGVPVNFIRGYLWWSMAKTQGNVLAAEGIDSLSAAMTPKQIATGQAFAAKCYESNYSDCE